MAVVEQAEMADRLPPVIGGTQQHSGALRAGIIAKRAADRRHGRQLVIRNHDRKDSKATGLKAVGAAILP
ncbi:hypothetical protein [Paracoccus alcaliphilus]|uniref:hypothetical protein n=1 Tax=Paracoccus alcaliphilus TaxID=34002 RepID=UPI00147D1F5C|nr:hypothetical protein [Paracoccus alcaliphilus]